MVKLMEDKSSLYNAEDTEWSGEAHGLMSASTAVW